MKLNKEQWSWALYDVGHSAYSIIIMTAIYPIVFQGLFDNAATGVASWGYMNSFASLVVAFFAPVIGSIADYDKMKGKVFKIFAFLGIIATFMLSFTLKIPIEFSVLFYVLSVVGFYGSINISNGYLEDICSSNDSYEKVSSISFSIGYAGSLLPFIIGVLLVSILPGMDLIDPSFAFMLVMLMTTLWWALFTIPFIKNVKQRVGKTKNKDEKIIKQSFIEVFKTIKNISKYKSVVLFLAAYFFFIDGVNTIFIMATPVASSIGINQTIILSSLVLIQFVAIFATLFYEFLARKIGNIRVLYVGIITYIIITLFASFFLQDGLDFILLGILVGSAQGGIQAISRAEYARIIPKEKANEFFGFFSILGKFASILGPFLISTITIITGDQQKSILSLLVLFLIGLVFLIMYMKNKNLKAF